VEKFIGLARYAIGETGGDRLRIRWNGALLVDLPLAQCRAAYEGAIPRWFGQAYTNRKGRVYNCPPP